MDFRKPILILTIGLCSLVAKTQVIPDYQQTDSLTYSEYQAGNWKLLIKDGELSLKNGLDFPLLRLRIAYAYFQEENYSKAAQHYENVLANDSYNETAKYYLYLSYKYLNRDLAASNVASKLDSAVLKEEHIKTYGLSNFNLETGFKYPGVNSRGNASYVATGLGLRLGPHLQFEQSISLFQQEIANAPTGIPPRVVITYSNTKQIEYYAKLGYGLSKQITILGAYHYLNTNFTNTIYQNHIGFAGIKYDSNYLSFQADASLGKIATANISQFNATVGVFPLGNLNLYGFTKASYLTQNNASRPVFSQVFGFKAIKNLWLEANASFGGLDDYLDADASFVFNSIDISKNKLGATLFYTFSPKSVFQFNYTFENKTEFTQQTNYTQHSITGGITWKF
jgi:hypothetical protein